MEKAAATSPAAVPQTNHPNRQRKERGTPLSTPMPRERWQPVGGLRTPAMHWAQKVTGFLAHSSELGIVHSEGKAKVALSGNIPLRTATKGSIETPATKLTNPAESGGAPPKPMKQAKPSRVPRNVG